MSNEVGAQDGRQPHGRERRVPWATIVDRKQPDVAVSRVAERFLAEVPQAGIDVRAAPTLAHKGS